MELGPRLGPYIPRAGGQDDGSSTKLPQTICGGSPWPPIGIFKGLFPLGPLKDPTYCAIVVVVQFHQSAALQSAAPVKDMSMPES